ncbi:MAG: zinc ribbon domain-containing protein [Thermoplasmata archaeon]
MVQCPGCGAENPQDVLFCSKCGTTISPARSLVQPIAHQDPGQELEKIGETIGREFEKIGKKIGEEAGRKRGRISSVFEQTFGLAWPFITSILGFSILVIITQVIAAATDGPIWIDTANFVVNYFWLFLGAMMLSDYNGYFLRRYRFN